MKIEVGKTYKSNVAARTKPGLEPEESRRVPEEWVIVASYLVGNEPMFVGRREGADGVVLVREFDENGTNGATKSGACRQLLPNTKTVADWGVVNITTGRFFANRFAGKPNTEEVAQERCKALPQPAGRLTIPSFNYAAGLVTYQVEE